MSNKSPIIPENITYNDLKYRLQNIQCCLPNKAIELLNRINLGINCCNEERELNIATAYLDILKCYITNWQAPYKYTNLIINGPYISFNLVVLTEEIPYDEYSEIFTGFLLTPTGYGISYMEAVSILTVIEDYKNTTGQDMELTNVTVNLTETIFSISLQVPCEHANTGIEWTFNLMADPNIITDKTVAGDCEIIDLGIIGPEYTAQDSANCLTREEVVNMFEWLQKYCCMCFPNYGNYDNVVTID